MLDKSIPYKDIIMRAPREIVESAPQPTLPEGFSFRFFEEGDEVHWARIETSVLEFKEEKDARDHFGKEFLPHLEELKRRCLFVANPEGLPIATATAWFENGESGQTSLLHWVAVCPGYQGLGLGKAVTLKVMNTFADIGPHTDVSLHTQTWSHVAVGMYHRLGFRMVRNADFDGAIEVLNGVMDKKTMRELVDTAW